MAAYADKFMDRPVPFLLAGTVLAAFLDASCR
jgi:hypothetical protein